MRWCCEWPGQVVLATESWPISVLFSTRDAAEDPYDPCQVLPSRDGTRFITTYHTSEYLKRKQWFSSDLWAFCLPYIVFLPWLAKISPEHMTKIKQYESFGNAGKAEGWRWWKQNSLCAQDMIFWTQEVTSALKSGSIAEYEKHLVGALDVDAAWLLQYYIYIYTVYIIYLYIYITFVEHRWINGDTLI